MTEHVGESRAQGGVERPVEHRPVRNRVVLDDDIARRVGIQVVVVRSVVEAVEAQALETIVGSEDVKAETVFFDDVADPRRGDVVELGASIRPVELEDRRFVEKPVFDADRDRAGDEPGGVILERGDRQGAIRQGDGSQSSDEPRVGRGADERGLAAAVPALSRRGRGRGDDLVEYRLVRQHR